MVQDFFFIKVLCSVEKFPMYIKIYQCVYSSILILNTTVHMKRLKCIGNIKTRRPGISNIWAIWCLFQNKKEA